MGWTVRRILALFAFLASGLNVYFWEFIRERIYSRIWEMIDPLLPSSDVMARAAITAALFATGAMLLWRTRVPAAQAARTSPELPQARHQPSSPIVDNREWLSGYEIWRLADPEMLKIADNFEVEVRRTLQDVAEIENERRALQGGLSRFDLAALNATPSPAMEALQQSALEAAQRNYAVERQLMATNEKITENIYGKLASGELIAKGFHHPLGNNRDYVEIPSHEWNILRFKVGNKEAEGQGIKYVGITVAKVR